MNAVVRMAEAHSPGIRVPPHSIEAEQAVLGGLMLAPDSLDKISDVVTESDFYRKDHRLIWRAITELSAKGRPCDAVTLADWFDSSGLADLIGGAGYCIELANATPGAANIRAHANIVREKSVLRQVIHQAWELQEEAYRGHINGVELVDQGIAALMSMQRIESNSEFTLRQAMSMAFADAERAKALNGALPGIASGISALDRILGGWHDSDLIVVGARPAMGKTALLLNFATSCALSSGIVSAEQPAKQIGGRVMSIKSHVPAERLRNGRFDTNDLRRLDAAMGELCDRTFQIYDRSAPTISDVCRLGRKWKQQNGLRILFVDYIQRIKAVETSARANKAERVGEVAQKLKDLARDLDIPVIALAQVKREAAGRQPRMDDLSDSSEIEKEADQILMLDRPAEYDESADPCKAIISVEKNRHGPTGEICAAWLAETMRFTDYASHD